MPGCEFSVSQVRCQLVEFEISADTVLNLQRILQVSIVES